MFIERKVVGRIELGHDSFIAEKGTEISSAFHLELVEVLSPCHALLNNLPCQLDAYDIVISKKLPRIAFFNKEPFKLRLISLDFKRQAVLDTLTMAITAWFMTFSRTWTRRKATCTTLAWTT